ncbi:MAG: YHS domain-containing protein [Chlamydiota bacterium]
MNACRIICVVVAVTVAPALAARAATAPKAEPASAAAGNTTPAGEVKEMKGDTCPVLGGKADKSISSDYKGTRYYFCCVGCQGLFKADPEKYIQKMPRE